MNSTSIFSEKSTAKTGIYIKGNFSKQKSFKYDNNNNNVAAGELQSEKEKAVIKDIFQITAAGKSITGNHKYTIQPGDDKRLSKGGVLTVYNIKEPIEIPVRRLLGTWRKSHVGVTLVITNGKWSIEGEAPEHRIHQPERGMLVALRMLLRFAMA